MTNRIEGDLDVSGHGRFGSLTIPSNALKNEGVHPDAAIARSKLALESLQVFPLSLLDFRVHDAPQSLLPNPSAADDLGIYGATFGTDAPTLRSSDLKAAGPTSLYGRIVAPVPLEYATGETIQLRIAAAMNTTVADVSATIDMQAYKVDRAGGLGSDLVTTAAQSINSLSFANKDFTLDGSGLSPGDLLDLRLTMAINDAATGTAVIGVVGAVELLCDVRG